MASSQESRNLDKAATAVGTADMVGFALFFGLMQATFFEIARLVLLPVAAAAAIIQAIIAWRQYHLNKHEQGFLFWAVIETAAALAVTTAVVGALAFSAIMGAAAGVIFASTLGAKAIISAGAACVYKGMSIASSDAADKINYQQKAIQFGAQSIAAAIGAVAVTMVMALGHVKLAALGVAAGVTGVFTGLGKAFGLWKKRDDGYAPMASEPRSDASDSDRDSVIGKTPSPAPRAAPMQSTANTFVGLNVSSDNLSKPEPVLDDEGKIVHFRSGPKPIARAKNVSDEYSSRMVVGFTPSYR